MINKPHVDWLALGPSNAMLVAMSVCLLGAVLVPQRSRRAFSAVVCALGYAVALALAVVVYVKSPDPRAIVGLAFDRDRLAALAQVLIAGAGFLSVLVSYGQQSSSDRGENEHVGEYYALLAAAGAGMIFFVGAENLMTLFLGLEWFSISLYILCAIEGERETALEAGLKYLIVGSFGSAVLLFGSALVYGATGELQFRAIGASPHHGDALLLVGLAMIIAGFGFKSSSAPFHMWTPDVYEGAPTPVTAFMSAATKMAALVVTLRVLREAFPQEARLWTVAIAVIAVASLAVGNLAALAQRNVKRMLAYSSVSHAGFMLVPIAANNALGAEALLYYLIPYGAMSIGAFAVIAARERELRRPVTLDNLAGFGWERPLLGLSMWFFMLGFVGFPVSGGFWGKILAFSAAQQRGWTWLVVLGVIATIVSLYYYLAVIRAMFMRSSAELQLVPVRGGSPPPERLLQTAVFACLAISVASLFAVQPLVDVAKHAGHALPF